ncbi:4502_t:CDS:2 [Paraglomus occultum]|uniref:4502_t:CDS:1 n=1 Tax=Paraglomus occultum TaxID=144539 RepID=A0A9N8ZZX5_9GLOM|nr:4502_t:CDS:2 [Paraglomus occultum]
MFIDTDATLQNVGRAPFFKSLQSNISVSRLQFWSTLHNESRKYSTFTKPHKTRAFICTGLLHNNVNLGRCFIINQTKSSDILAQIRCYTTPTPDSETLQSSATIGDDAPELIQLAPTTSLSLSDPPDSQILESTVSVAADPITADVIADAALKIGDLKAMGLVHSTPVGLVESLVEAIHVYSGLPWWSTIVALSVIVRVALLPLNIASARNVAKMAIIQPKIQALMEQVNEAKKQGDQATMLTKSQETAEIFRKAGVNPFKNFFIAAVQAPIMISIFLAIRDMARFPVPGFKTGGVLWIQDLTLPDPYYILPIATAVGFLAVLETAETNAAPSGQAQKLKNTFRFVALLGIPFASYLPAGCLVFFSTNSALSITQTFLLRNKAFKRALDIPEVPKYVVSPKPSPTPQKSFREQFQSLYGDSQNLQRRQRKRI